MNHFKLAHSLWSVLSYDTLKMKTIAKKRQLFRHYSGWKCAQRYESTIHSPGLLNVMNYSWYFAFSIYFFTSFKLMLFSMHFLFITSWSRRFNLSFIQSPLWIGVFSHYFFASYLEKSLSTFRTSFNFSPLYSGIHCAVNSTAMLPR